MADKKFNHYDWIRNNLSEGTSGHDQCTHHEINSGNMMLDAPNEALSPKKRQLLTSIVSKFAKKAVEMFVPEGYGCKDIKVEVCIKKQEELDD